MTNLLQELNHYIKIALLQAAIAVLSVLSAAAALI
ncbi:hypothetical protein RLON56S_03584 [Alishewanella longhuensis]